MNWKDEEHWKIPLWISREQKGVLHTRATISRLPTIVFTRTYYTNSQIYGSKYKVPIGVNPAL